jgi:hypothetical protein
MSGGRNEIRGSIMYALTKIMRESKIAKKWSETCKKKHGELFRVSLDFAVKVT